MFAGVMPVRGGRDAALAIDGPPATSLIDHQVRARAAPATSGVARASAEVSTKRRRRSMQAP
jgi:hypothetical protein